MTPARTHRVLLLILWGAASFPGRARADDCWEPAGQDPKAVRAVVVIAGESDPAVAAGVAALGGNLVATVTPPNAGAAAAARSAGLGYLPRLSMQDIDRLLFDGGYLAAVRAMPAIAGFQYIDLDVTEGFESPASQAFAYGTLKALFPDRIVLRAMRLDPIATDPSYLSAHYRPEFTDFVTPYFYPVGTTVLGTQAENDPWEGRLRSLLGPLAAATPPDKAVLPVLQTFEQIGYPVGGGIVRRQLDVYREFWPRNRNVAAFWWGGPNEAEPLVGLAELPRIARGVRRIFGAAPSRLAPCALPSRAPVQSRP